MEVVGPHEKATTLRRLRDETQPQHEALEAALDLVSPSLTLSRYGLILSHFGVLYEHLEPTLNRVVIGSELANDLEWSERQKLDALRADLTEFELPTPVLKAELEIDQSQPGSVLGVLYVLEGATLGGQYIARHVVESLPTTSVRFFSSYGDDVGRRWVQFREAVRLHAPDGSEAADNAVASAIATFGLFQRQLAPTF